MTEHQIVVQGPELARRDVVHAARGRRQLAPPYMVSIVAFRHLPEDVPADPWPIYSPGWIEDALAGLADAAVIEGRDVVRVDFRLTETRGPNPPRTHIVVRSLADKYRPD